MAKRVLLADDSVTVRKVAELAFGETDIRLDAVGSGEEAMRRIPELEPDLILADVVMPEPTGYEICRQVKASARPVPVLLLAGTFEPFDPKRAREVGADGYVLKPFESQNLLEKVQLLMARPIRPPRGNALETPDPVPDRAPTAVREGEKRPRVPPPRAKSVEEERARGEGPPRAIALTAEQIEAIAAIVVERISQEIVRQLASKVVPEVVETVVRERLRELARKERDVPGE